MTNDFRNPYQKKIDEAFKRDDKHHKTPQEDLWHDPWNIVLGALAVAIFIPVVLWAVRLFTL